MASMHYWKSPVEARLRMMVEEWVEGFPSPSLSCAFPSHYVRRCCWSKASAGDDAAAHSPLPPQAWVLWLMAWSQYKTPRWFKRPLWFNHNHSKQCISGWQLSGKGSIPFKFHWFRMYFISNKLACKQTSPAWITLLLITSKMLKIRNLWKVFS